MLTVCALIYILCVFGPVRKYQRKSGTQARRRWSSYTAGSPTRSWKGHMEVEQTNIGNILRISFLMICSGDVIFTCSCVILSICVTSVETQTNMNDYTMVKKHLNLDRLQPMFFGGDLRAVRLCMDPASEAMHGSWLRGGLKVLRLCSRHPFVPMNSVHHRCLSPYLLFQQQKPCLLTQVLAHLTEQAPHLCKQPFWAGLFYFQNDISSPADSPFSTVSNYFFFAPYHSRRIK